MSNSICESQKLHLSNFFCNELDLDALSGGNVKYKEMDLDALCNECDSKPQVSKAHII